MGVDGANAASRLKQCIFTGQVGAPWKVVGQATTQLKTGATACAPRAWRVRAAGDIQSAKDGMYIAATFLNNHIFMVLS
jgi:hypothetical protein